MLNMILPMVIATIGYFLAHLGSDSNIKFFTVIGGILIFVAVMWLIYNTSFNLAYMLY